MLNPLSRYLMIGKLIALLGAIALISWQSSQIHRWHKHYNDEAAAHQRDIGIYRQAQKDAAAQNKAQVARVEQHYQEITDDTQSSYARDHAELVRMRQQRDAALASAASAAGSSQDHAAAAGADGHAVPIPSCDHVQDDAADIELRLMHLQNYVRGILGVDPNR